MANYLVIYPVPETHLEFLISHPQLIDCYFEGQLPDPDSPPPRIPAKTSFWDRLLGKNAKAPIEEPVGDLPPDWPDEEATAVDMEVNHRNVDLYHWLLNGTKGPVGGSGSLFQTWFAQHHTAVTLDAHGERFAFHARQIPELLAIAEGVTRERLRESFSQWLKSQGKPFDVLSDEVGQFDQEFENLRQTLKRCVAEGCGLVWITC